MPEMWHRGDVIRKLRDSQDWSQADLAHRAGVHPKSVARAEQNEPTVSMDVWYKLAAALGTSMEDVAALLQGFERTRMTSLVTASDHRAGSQEPAVMETPKSRLIHFVAALSEEHATVLLPLVQQWFAKLIGGQSAKGEPPPRK